MHASPSGAFVPSVWTFAAAKRTRRTAQPLQQRIDFQFVAQPRAQTETAAIYNRSGEVANPPVASGTVLNVQA